MEIEETERYSKWFSELKDIKAKAKIRARLFNIKCNAHFGESKNLKDNVSELKINYGPGYRVYYTKQGSKLVLLLAGGDKSTQNRDIKMAKQLAEEWRI